MHATTDSIKTAPRRRPDTVPWMAAWTGETVIETPVIIRRRRLGGIAYADELPSDRGKNDALLHRGRRLVNKDQCGRPLYGAVHTNRQRRAMRKLLCHVCGNRADHNERGVLWLLDNIAANCPQGWPEEVMCLVGCTMVDLDTELVVGGVR